MLLAGPSVEARRGLSDAKSDPPEPHFHRPTNLGTEGLKPVAGSPDISLQGVIRISLLQYAMYRLVWNEF